MVNAEPKKKSWGWLGYVIPVALALGLGLVFGVLIKKPSTDTVSTYHPPLLHPDSVSSIVGDKPREGTEVKVIEKETVCYDTTVIPKIVTSRWGIGTVNVDPNVIDILWRDSSGYAVSYKFDAPSDLGYRLFIWSDTAWGHPRVEITDLRPQKSKRVILAMDLGIGIANRLDTTKIGVPVSVGLTVYPLSWLGVRAECSYNHAIQGQLKAMVIIPLLRR